MSFFHEPKRQGEKRLNVAARAIGEDSDLHDNILPGGSCYTDKRPRKAYKAHNLQNKLTVIRLIQTILKRVAMSKIGILHPGEMGISIAASALNSGYEVYWLSEGRSSKTRARAERYNLKETNSLFQLCQTCEVIISICPPHAAEEIAVSVSDSGFRGLYLDANAISPQRTASIAQML